MTKRQSKDRQSPAAANLNWHSSGILLLSLVLLPLVGVLAFAAPVWAVVLLRLLTDGGLLLLWLAAATGAGLFVLRAARLCDSDAPLALHFSSAAALGLGLMSIATLGLGLAGWLNALTAWAILGVGWALGGVTFVQTRRETQLSLKSWLNAPAGWAWLFLLATPFLVLALVAAMTPPLMLWTPEEPHGYDVVEYHLQIPREWYEAHRIIPLHHNVFSFFPFNVEMHYLLAMHLRGGPWAGMYLAQLMHLAFFVLTVVAVYSLARRFARPASAAIAALSLLTVPWITQLAGIAYDEGGFLLFGTLSIGFAIIATFEAQSRIRRFALAGVMAGFAAGSKLTAVPEVMVAVPIVCALAGAWMLIKGRGNDAGTSLWLGIITFGFVALLSFSPWLIRNMAWAGNPVFPEMMPLLGKGDFSPGQVERFEKAHKPLPAQQLFAERVKALNREVLGWWPILQLTGDRSAWQFGYIILPMALAALFLSFRRPESWCLFGLLLILTIFWLLMTHLQSRFFILAAPIAALMIARIDWGRATIAGVALVMVFAAVGWMRINDRLSKKLYGDVQNSPGIVTLLGADGASIYEQMTPIELPKIGTIFLIGDARAFLYPVPMSRLRYRTVFDIKNEGTDIEQAWLGDGHPLPGDCVMVDPGELKRFSRTYVGLPPVSAAIERAQGPFVLKP